jgi:endoglucanase
MALAAAVALAVLGPAGSAVAQQPDPRGSNPAAPNPLAGLRFYVDRHRHPAWRQYRVYRKRHRRHAAALMLRVARQPKFQWFGRWNHPPRVAVKKYLQRARRRQPGAVPLLAAMRHQGKRCRGGYDGGGPREDARTRKWYRGFARGVGRRRVVIAFEPDSLGTLECIRKGRRMARLRLLRYGVNVMSKLPNATIYLEGGASDWERAARTARQLRIIGISKVRGFMLNVTHYDWTRSNIRHGLEMSRLTGGKHFIVSTAFNGRGPVHYRKRVSGRTRRINVWCHPLKRGLGAPPTTATSRPDKVDAYMWIGRPGYSGGSCNGGLLPVGSWWPKRALMFAKYATSWEGPPHGTRFGLFRHYTLTQLGARG